MFGRKKEITQKFIVKQEEELADLTNVPKRDKTKNSIQDNADNNFIFYGSDNKFSKQLEIYATLKENSSEIQNSKNKKLVLIVVDSNASMEFLSYKILESFGQYPEYQNLEGLTATNLTKMDEEKKNLTKEGKVGDVLRNGDIIYLDLISNEIWIKINYIMNNIINKNKKLNVSMDVKIKNDLSFKELRIKLLKCGIMCYLNNFSKSNEKFHFIISGFNLSHSTHGNIDDNKLKMFENMKIRQLFKFKDSIKIEIKFYPIEFILFQKLKALYRQRKEKSKKILWNRFKTLKFRDLLINKFYINEKEYIFNYIKKIFSNKATLSKCYIYSIDNDSNTDTTDDILDDTKYDKKEEDNLSNSNINNRNESSELIEMDSDLKRHNKSVSDNNQSSLNRSSRTKTLYGTNTNSICLMEDNKYTLIVLPPKDDEEEEENDYDLIKKNKLSSKNDLLNRDNDAENDINEEDEEDDFLIQKKNKNENLKKKDNKFKPYYGSLNFELTNKNKLLEYENEMITYDEDLNPKQILKKPSSDIRNNKLGIAKKNNLCSDFEIYFDKNKFLDFINGLYLLNIKKGSLEKSTIPYYRGFKSEEKKIAAVNPNKKKKRKVKKPDTFYTQVFPIKRINFELGVLSLFILSILGYLSYLLSNSYF